ncbi:MAG: Transcriptional regulator, TetR family [Frankiales bacterium]|nr:Transcriptional regulator, TetR family [Frankiales bacterium]
MNAKPAPRRLDPLSEILLCPTTEVAAPVAGMAAQPVSSAPADSAAAVSSGRTSIAGVHGAAAQQLARSRSAILVGARSALLSGGTRVTMSQIATEAGVAKATLYNHFRTRDDVFRALLVDEIDALIASIAHLELRQALLRAAAALSEHPLLEALGGDELALLADLARVDISAMGWQVVANATDNLLRRAGRAGTPTVLRWLSSFLVAPAEIDDIEADVAVLFAGLPEAPMRILDGATRPRVRR